MESNGCWFTVYIFRDEQYSKCEMEIHEGETMELREKRGSRK